MKNRYTLVGPVEGGSQFWQINDTEEMFALVSISVSFPNAQKETEFLYRRLMAQEKHERDKVWKTLTEEQTEGADRMPEDHTPLGDSVVQSAYGHCQFCGEAECCEHARCPVCEICRACERDRDTVEPPKHEWRSKRLDQLRHVAKVREIARLAAAEENKACAEIARGFDPIDPDQGRAIAAEIESRQEKRMDQDETTQGEPK